MTEQALADFLKQCPWYGSTVKASGEGPKHQGRCYLLVNHAGEHLYPPAGAGIDPESEEVAEVFAEVQRQIGIELLLRDFTKKLRKHVKQLNFQGHGYVKTLVYRPHYFNEQAIMASIAAPLKLFVHDSIMPLPPKSSK